MRMPRPPPPAAALIITGKPIFSASANAASGESRRPRLPGTVGTPAAAAASRAATLSPIRRMDCAVGPTKTVRRLDRGGELGILGQKSIARMDGVGAGCPGRGENRIAVEI